MTESSRPRLLVLASTYPRWAGDHEPGFVHELARRLVNSFEVTVLCPHALNAERDEMLDGVHVVRHIYAPACMETLVNDGGMVSNLRGSPWKWLLVPPFLVSQALATWKIVRILRPNVVHAHWLLPQGLIITLLGLVERRTPPVVVTSHGADLFALRMWPLPLVKRFIVKRAAEVTVVSEAMREELAKLGVPLGEVRVEPMGVDLTNRFVPDPEIVRSRDEILFVGRLVEKKGLRHLIEAIPEVLARHPSAFLTVVGFGPEESACRALTSRLGLDDRVRFLGAVAQADLPMLYRRAAVFVAPFVEATSGDQEGLGLVAIEAAGCGCPVVVSRLPATRQFIERALLVRSVPPADSRALAVAICEVLAARGNFSARSNLMDFDWGARAASYGQLLAKTARGADGRR